jgi:hypothetical protein
VNLRKHHLTTAHVSTRVNLSYFLIPRFRIVRSCGQLAGLKLSPRERLRRGGDSRGVDLGGVPAGAGREAHPPRARGPEQRAVGDLRLGAVVGAQVQLGLDRLRSRGRNLQNRLRSRCRTNEQIEPAKQAVDKMLADLSPAVRIAAAETLSQWEGHDKALPVLVELLKHKSDSVRLSAAIALGNLGEKAKPAVTEIRAGLDDPYENVHKVNKRTLQLLENAK